MPETTIEPMYARVSLWPEVAIAIRGLTVALTSPVGGERRLVASEVVGAALEIADRHRDELVQAILERRGTAR